MGHFGLFDQYHVCRFPGSQSQQDIVRHEIDNIDGQHVYTSVQDFSISSAFLQWTVKVKLAPLWVWSKIKDMIRNVNISLLLSYKEGPE